jgi:hypothetical protein
VKIDDFHESPFLVGALKSNGAREGGGKGFVYIERIEPIVKANINKT